MDLEFSEEQKMLQRFARDFLTDKSPMGCVKDMEEDERGYSADLWQEMADLGWMGLVFPEEYGGSGMDFLDLTLLLEEIGRSCLPGPFFSTVVLGGLTILDIGSEEQKQEFLPKISQGKMILALALTEPSGTYTPAGISTKAVAGDDDYIINGIKLFVSDAHVADYLICVTRTKEGIAEDGITLFLVDTKSPGISYALLKTIAFDKQCEVVFDNVTIPKKNVLGEMDKGWAGVEKIIERAAVAKCAEMIGGAQQVLEMTVNYAKERVQFGRPIGSFQAIQHHCANMAIDVDGSKLITYQAAWALSEGLPCAREAAMAKAWVSEAYKRIVSLGHQVHGAIGFTKDYDLQLYFKRAKAAELAFGDADFHRETVAVAMGL